MRLDKLFMSSSTTTCERSRGSRSLRSCGGGERVSRLLPDDRARVGERAHERERERRRGPGERERPRESVEVIVWSSCGGGVVRTWAVL
jgi:hypothetical protein